MNPFLFVWIALLVGVFWFMILRPRREAARRSLEVSRSLDVGEEVITIGGLYGTIASIDEREVELEVSDGVTLRFARRAIAGKAPVDEPEDDDLEDDELEDDELENHEDDEDDDLVIDAELEDDAPEEPVIEPARNADESSGR
jgi:preprotein translocase subunit YajC